MVVIVCSWIVPGTTVVRGEGRTPEINVTKSARFDELENMHFVGYIALPTDLHSHVPVGSAI